MPLSEPKERELLHSRDITLRGYRRSDGLFDIEARLSDTKSHRFDAEERGMVAPGEKLHDMWMRMVVDEDMTVVECEAETDASPYGICPSAAPGFGRIAGLRIKPGFLREANARVGGTIGCTHLRELLQQMATTAYQTIYSERERRASAAPRSRERAHGARPSLLGTCVAYAPDSPVVRRRWPHLEGAEKAAAGRAGDING